MLHETKKQHKRLCGFWVENERLFTNDGQRLRYSIVWDDDRKWIVRGKYNSHVGFVFEKEFKFYEEAELEVYWLENPAKRPKK